MRSIRRLRSFHFSAGAMLALWLLGVAPAAAAAAEEPPSRGLAATTPNPVEQETETPFCVLGTVDIEDGLGPRQVGSAPRTVDFGLLSVGDRERRILTFGFNRPLFRGEQGEEEAIGVFDASTGSARQSLRPPFRFGTDAFNQSFTSYQIETFFEPTRPGRFTDSVLFLTSPDFDSERSQCWQRVDFVGEAVGPPELTLTFDEPVCGSPSTVVATVTNNSLFPVEGVTATSTFELRELGSFDNRDFSLDEAGGPNSSRSFEVVYREGFSGSVSVRHPLIATISQNVPPLTCLEVTAPPSLTLDFGEVQIGAPAAEGSIVVRNHGTTSATVNASLSSNGSAQGFSLGASSNSIPAGSQASFPVSFAPTSTGPKSAAVTLNHPALPPNQRTVTLLGGARSAPAPMLSFQVSRPAEQTLSPGQLIDLGVVELGDSAERVVTIRNSGNAPAQITDARIAAGAETFSLSPTGAATIPSGGGALDYTLRFQPDGTGPRNGELRITASNPAATYSFALRADGALSMTSVRPVELPASILTAQTSPYPTVGLELSAPAQAAMRGTLQLRFQPAASVPLPDGFEERYGGVVRFLDTGAQIPFEIALGRQRAVFPSETGGNSQLARFQAGTVEGQVLFRVENLETVTGTPVPLAGDALGQAAVTGGPPVITRPLQTEASAGGRTLILEGYSSSRAITGVCVQLSAASGTELEFQRPAVDFANSPFSAWYLNADSGAAGGAFRLTVPVNITNQQAFGSANMWVRNAAGWSDSNNPCAGQ